MNQTLQLALSQFYDKNNSQVPPVITISDLRSFINESIRYVSLEDSKYLFDDLTKQKTQFSKEEAFEIFYNFQNEAVKVFNRVQPQIGLFILESLIRVQPSQQKDNTSQLAVDDSQYVNENKVNISRSFSYILSEDYLKKLVNMGANGIINQKQEEKVLKYSYNHWVESNEKKFMITQTQRLQVQLLKNIWSFQFQKALQTAEKILQKVQNQGQINDEQIISLSEITYLIPGLQNLNEIQKIMHKHPLLKLLIQNRHNYQIEFKEQLLKKANPQLSHNPDQLLVLRQQFNDFMQLWNFTQQYFSMIEPQLTNPYYKQIVAFISSTDNDKEKSQDQVDQLAQLEQIGIIERFLYAKKYFSQQNFQLFKTKIRQKSYLMMDLDYILLFGNKKESEIILQNYLDQTSDIQKVALISVYLKTFSQQTRMISSLRTAEQKSCYAKFIYVYQWLLDKIQGGLSRHQFGKKCLDIEIERKTKNLTKTFTFDCTNCRAPQIYSILSKKINIDSKQPKLKGYHYFAKDNRLQIMHCIQCMIMLPKCSICLYPISVYNAYAQEMKKNATHKKSTNKGQPINRAVVWCPKCKHGGHFDHIVEWFSENKRKCPVANCKCKCSL